MSVCVFVQELRLLFHPSGKSETISLQINDDDIQMSELFRHLAHSSLFLSLSLNAFAI